MNEEEKKELQELINLLYNNHLSQYGKRKLEAYIKKQQRELDKKDKIIDLMTKELVDSLETCPFDMYDYEMENCKNCEDYFEKCWIEYFTKKVEE